MKILKNVPMSDMNTFKIGGIADFFIEVTNIDELDSALIYSKKEKIPFFILGGGSNLLVSDQGFRGLVIKISFKGLNIENDILRVGAGEGLDDFVKKSIESDFVGIAELSLIPGTVGGAIVQNAGAYGLEIKDVVQSVTVLNIDTMLIEKIENAHCEFSYRNSLFKRNKKLIVIEAIFDLKKNGSVEKRRVRYKDLEKFGELQTEDEIRHSVVCVRRSKLPDIGVGETPDTGLGTAGSFYKNPIIGNDEYNHLKNKFPELPGFKVDTESGAVDQISKKIDLIKVPLGYIVDKICGLRGYRSGPVGIYDKQSIVLINYGGAKAEDILSLSNFIEKNVYEKTGIKIEREVELL